MSASAIVPGPAFVMMVSTAAIHCTSMTEHDNSTLRLVCNISNMQKDRKQRPYVQSHFTPKHHGTAEETLPAKTSSYYVQIIPAGNSMHTLLFH